MDQPNPYRRKNLRQLAGLLATAGVATLFAPGRAHAQPEAGGERPYLVAYFSRTGHTRQAALALREAVEADLFEIVPATPYPAEYQDAVDLNSRQRAAGEYPGVAGLIPDLARYDTVFLGYPIWAVDLPLLLYPFLRQQDFNDKTIAPFCTSAMSGPAGTVQTLQRLCPRARVAPGSSLPGGGRGRDTRVTSIGADARRRAEQWARQSMEASARR
jgi:flavodoxin